MAGVEDAGDAVSGDLAFLFGADDHDPHGLPPESGLRGGYRRRSDRSVPALVALGTAEPRGGPRRSYCRFRSW
jgi:hypothetical protein